MKFVNLHGHDGMSVYDGLGSPEEYAEWMLENAGEESGALAITNHGNMNSIGAMVAAQQKYDKAGAPVKFLYGVESYFIPSLFDWQIEKQQTAEAKKLQKKKRKKSKNDDPDDGIVIENEKESKKKYYDPIKRRHHLVLVAINNKGLENLFRLVSRSYREGMYRKPRVDLAMLRQHNEGIIASTACLAGVPTWCSFHPNAEDDEAVYKIYERELGPLMEIFGPERFFLELQFNKIPEQQVTNRHLIEFSNRSGFNLIATADCHYPKPELFRDREIYRLLGYQMMKSDDLDMSITEKTIDELDANLFLKNGDQMFEAYKETFRNVEEHDALVRDAIQRTYDIAHDVCEKIIPDSSYKLPQTFQVTKDIKSPFDKLKSLVLKGLREKGLHKKKEYVERAAFELKVIRNLEVEEYFLAKVEIIDTLKKHMLIGPGRGSAAGSLVCYLIGITLIDPMRHGLLFERFMNPSRAEMPDIDSDFELKEEALDILKDHFGESNVVAISNYNRLQLKSLIKDISRLYGVSYSEANALTKKMEKEAKPHIMEVIGHDQKLYDFNFEYAKKYSKTFQEFLKKYPQVGEHITNLYQEVKSIGRHAGGVLIVPDAEGCLPIIRIRGIDQSPITEGITAQHLQYFGLIKFDVLGLATLKIIRRCIEGILRQEGVKNPTIDDVWEWYNANIHPDIIDPEDKEVFETVYHKGQWPSIFQFSKPDVQKFCTQAKPESVNDISAITALWRPGPLKGKANVRYLGANDPKAQLAFQKEHEVIKKHLGDTRGILVYQEQFMLLANELAGFSLEETNKLRKSLVKPATTLSDQLKKERIKQGKQFVAGAEKAGLSHERAERLWDKEILGFISYGFNKSHSMSYAYNSYQCAWLYTYYPRQWIKACLECDPKPDETLDAVRSLGYIIDRPNVNKSAAHEWTVDESGVCHPPFTALKGVGASAAEELVRVRPEGGFTSLEDFFWENDVWRWKKLNKKTLQVLLRTDAFEELDCVGKQKIFRNYRHLDNALFGVDSFINGKTKDGKDKVQAVTFDKIKQKKISLEELAFLADDDDWTTPEKIEQQEEIFGFFDKELIVGEYKNIFEEFEIKAIDEAPDPDDSVKKKKLFKNKVWGLVEKVTEKTTRKKRKYLLVQASGRSAKKYYFKVWGTSKDKTKIWKKGYVVVFSLDFDEEWGYNVSRGVKPIRITK